MNSKLSALLDGELEADEVRALCHSLRRHPDLARDARAYALLGASLRGEPVAGGDIAGRVMAALADEPVVLAPRLSVIARWQRPALALAASLAGVLVVAAVVLAPQGGRVGETISPVARQQAPVETVAAQRQLAAADMQEYLIAHQAHSMGATLGAGSQQIRTVSLVDEGSAR